MIIHDLTPPQPQLQPSPLPLVGNTLGSSAKGEHWPNRINSFSLNETMRLVQKPAEKSSAGFVEVELTSRFYGDDCDMANLEKAKQFRAMVSKLLQLGTNNKNNFMPILTVLDYEILEKRLKKITFLKGLLEEHRLKRRRKNRAPRW
ncbi:hypothetical protein PIB30_082772 [Stylosanthes scabra]|uniref:Uncharacterized protein n=1 Tax=Stylosanthes scabra TaxID=79078 RepID=A0ABU6RSJ3_9FABA|nr:hypothetical protein [Stylosanthes scabra]